MSFADLSRLAQERPLRMLLVNAGEADAITWAGLIQPLRLAASLLGKEQLVLDVMTPEQAAAAQQSWQLALLVGDDAQNPMPPEQSRSVLERCRSAPFWGGVGSAVLWLAEAGAMGGVRIALPWALYAETEDITERAILTPHLFELDGRHLSCCGGRRVQTDAG
jgi:transcriptional regulator GlxA family with amidase domain